jgi:hypothetical protein
MFEFLKKVFSLKPKTAPAEVPYKVEVPAESITYKVPEPAPTTPIPLTVKPDTVVETEPVKKPSKPRKPKAEASAITSSPKKTKVTSDKPKAPKAPKKPKITIAK